MKAKPDEQSHILGAKTKKNEKNLIPAIFGEGATISKVKKISEKVLHLSCKASLSAFSGVRV